MLNSILIAAGLLMAGLSEGFEQPVADTLHSVTVTADKGVVVSRKDTLSASNSFSISDILLQSPGLNIGDNGGYAGLKTVSLRGLGSAHTSVYIDGVRVGNVQSGQNDLGMIDSDNVGNVVLDYAQNSVSFNTAKPVFGKSPFAGKVRLSAGSFATYLPSARLDFRLSERLSLSANASGVFSKGDFRYGEGEFRTNNDIQQVKSGLDLFGLTDGGDWHLKAYFNWVERGTPGSVSWPSDDRQRDRNAFIQGRMTNRFSPIYTLNLSFKGAYDDIFYTSSYGDSHYGQTELQLNSSHNFQIRKWWKLSFAADICWDGLASDNYDARRLSALTALASSFVTDRFTANVAVEYNGAFDAGALSRNAVSPSVDLKYTVAKGLDVTAFARRAYRIPVFNELYYAGYGNPDLKPEDAWMTDLGVNFSRRSGSWDLRTRIDGFCNWLTDKITSAPTDEDPNVWRPYNIGKVLSYGADVIAGVIYRSGDWECHGDFKYTLQSATDRTPGSYSFGQQIPYHARNIAFVSLKFGWRGWNLAPVWHWRGGRTDGIGTLPDWNTIDLDLSKNFVFRGGNELLLRITARNMADCRYETVSGYPMPGRNFTAGVEYRF